MIQNADMKLESGTCNVCSAPCSSCIHLSRALTRPKAKEFSDENCHLGEANQFSTDEGDQSSRRSRTCERLNHASSGTGNMLSVNSSHESLSENAESTRVLSEKYRDAKFLEGLDDNASCISRTSDADLIPVINGNTAVLLTRVYPKSESDSDSDVGNVKDKNHKVPVRDGLHEKQGEQVKSPVKPEAHSEDESDDSDVEHDVKVCDICGDAGREELLAVCSRCSDGAEHTYCMREMLEKVPEGDWLCEECKYAQETENQKLGKINSTALISGKRPLESEELAKAAKKQALESNIGSPKGSSPKRVFPLSRESSFKNLDKGKLKSGYHSSICNHPDGSDRELARSLSAGPRSQTTKSTLLKSNSFTTNSNPRVKLVDEVPQKKKGGSEHASKDSEAPRQIISKSTSFKSSNLSSSNATESKVKMLTSKSGTTQDLKGSRLTKESDRKFLSRVDQPVVCSTISKPIGDHKLSPHGETSKPSAVNNRERKVNPDVRSNSLSKSKNNINRKSSAPLFSAERIATSGEETQLDGAPQSIEFSNQIDNAKDSSIDHVSSGLTNASGSSVFHKSKDFGHATECRGVANREEFSLEGSTTAPNSSKDKIHKDNRLKAAIQAALLRRPEICKKKEVPDRTDEFSTSGRDLNSEVSSQDQSIVINTQKNILSTEETKARQEILHNPTFETPSSNGSKPVSFGPIQPRKLESVGPDPGNPVVRDFQNQALAVSSVLSQIAVFPEHQFIWQGVFQVHRYGKLPNLYTGIQAHLSTCASPKVLEVVNKFLPEVSLDEVSRLSTWPSQFHQGGAREDNIALYFFAEDIESYRRHYKGLLDHMIRNDLALKGSFDGVELLIFPSNQLPENSQRWNMLFFLWGVFRGHRMNNFDSARKVCIPSLNAVPVEKDFPTSVMNLSETHSSLKRMDEQSIACGRTCSAVLPSTSIGEGPNVFHGDFDIKETSDEACLASQVNLHRQDSRINTKSTLEIPSSSGQLCQELHSAGSSPKDGQQRVPTPPEAMRTLVSNWIVETNSDYDISVKQENSLSSGIPSAEKQETDAASNTSENQISERINHDEDQHRPKRKLIEEDLNISIEATLQEDPSITIINCQQTNDKKVQHIDVSNAVLKASTDSYQKLPWDKVNGKLEDGESSSKKLKSGLTDIYGSCSSGGRESSNGSFTGRANHPGTFSSVEDLGTMERTFFPVDSHKKNDSQLMLNGMPLEGSCEYEGQFQVGIPNLELALGGKIKPQPLPVPAPPHKGMFPFLVGAVDKKNNQKKPPEVVGDEQEGDNSVAASLSLSLSFPSSNKEPVKPAPKAEHSTDGHHVNTPFLLFGRYTDK
ncbi:hypothetical protein HN51_010707 [Arachis hypogaea]|uniref:PHD-type domain-containing protein n=1 Tax=Arachis hypogaea TaxID=3818 RepID=A0A445E279_ARAHY|nr:uncharacterized protein LOC112789342 [Arachis hypogaea]QHO55837.1 Bromodomain adjacent to zinc finger domain protein 1A [Arachis hypogaea]RYR69528.1 hypothetical protein Ahy_A03g016084 [Arachis hypogaea]